LLDGRVTLAKWEDRTTLAGVAMFVDSNGYERRMDFMQSAYGMNSEDVRNTAVHIDLILADGQTAPVWVMHPERCMESRVHNSVLATSRPTSRGGSCAHRFFALEPSVSFCSTSAERQPSGMC
jgi:hypothetical protein